MTIFSATEMAASPFYVSPDGNDGNAGTEGAPFRSIERARDAVRSASSGQNSDIVVYLRGGRYELGNTVRFTGQDAGKNGHRITYRAYPGEVPVLSGGKRVSGWEHWRDGIYRARAPGHQFRQLFVNDQWAIRARTPNNGNFHRVSSWNNGGKTLQIPANQISHWNNLQDVEMVVMKHWHQSRFRIASFSVSGGTATVIPRDPERTVEWLVEWPNRESNQAYYFENALEFLDTPGEWYHDRGAGWLYYMPREGENMANVEVIAPRLESLVEVDGAHNVTFRGLHFKHSTWNAPSSEGFIGIQANATRVLTTGFWIPSAVSVKNAHRVRFERNLFRHIGSGGLELHSGTYRTEVEGNVFADIAANGISVYTLLGNRNPAAHIRSRNDVVRNNLVTRVGQDYTGAVGIYASYTEGLIIENNEISDSPYSAVNVGWGWTNQETGTRNNRVRYNKIHGIMNLMDDGAAVYTLSKQHNTVVEENHIHDLVRNPWAGYYEIAALYLDEQSEGITMRNNVVQNLSGVMLWKENRANMHGNSVHTNGDGIPNQASIIANAGIQPAYQDVKGMLNGQPINDPGDPGDPAESRPWGDEPAAIPGRIQAENFDHGGPGVAYHDATSHNQGGAHRPGENVDIETTNDSGGSYNVGWTVSGEWLQYTVDVKHTGTYDLTARVAAVDNTRHFQVLVDGKSVSDRIDVPNTGGWQSWETVTVSGILLEEGERTVRIRIDEGGFNLNWFEFAGQAEALTVAITSPGNHSSFSNGDPIEIAASVTDAAGEIVRVEFFAGLTKIGDSSSNPYSMQWNNPPSGSHVLTARATTADGSYVSSSPLAISVGDEEKTGESGPYHGEPISIPGRIQAEEFDHGGQGVAYHDTSERNTGGAFRPNEYVDIEETTDTGGGYNIGWIARDEWTEYTVNVTEAGTYDLHVRVATPHDGRYLRILSNGQDVSGRIDIPNTGDWQNWETVTVSGLLLDKGVQTLRVAFDSDQFNFNYFELSSDAAQDSSTYSAWSESHFTPDELNDPEVSGDTGDPDGDGVPNLLEYAFGGNPLTPNRTLSPKTTIVREGGESYMAITFTRNPAASDLDFIVEASTDMEEWKNGDQTVEYSVEPNGAMETVTYRDKFPLSWFNQRYLRLRVDRTSN